jgi:integrase
MGAAQKHKFKLKRATYSTMIGLLASTGMRVGEVLALNRSDFNAEQGLLLIRCTKFGKTRQIPLHQSTIEALCRFEKERDRLAPYPSECFFVSGTGKRVMYSAFHNRFHHWVCELGLRKGNQAPGPRLHDLRHSFAVKTLVDWYRAGLDVDPKLPALSTYLGHVSPSCTYWYLSATPELLAQACRRLEKIPGGQS